jgi:hypothetical protein
MRRFVVALIIMVPGLARADRKSFSYTYEYATLPEGQTELEIWHTEARDTWKANTSESFEEKLEIEHGITDHWDMSMYTVLAQSTQPGDEFHLDAVRVESRYRFADRGEWPVDTVAYLEVAKDFGTSLYEIEAKGIFARDFDKVTVAGNVIGEVTLGNNVPKTELDIGWAAGATYEVTPKVRLGVETWGGHEDETTRWAVGPALSLAPSSKFWLVGTAGFGLADTVGTDDFAGTAFSARVIMGLEM